MSLSRVEQDKIIEFILLSIQKNWLSSLASILKEAGSQINLNQEVLVDNKPITALIFACIFPNRKECAQLLLAYKAEVNMKCKKYGNTALHYAVEEANISVLSTLLEAKADINAKNNRGDTPLISAAFGNTKTDCLEKLIEMKADLNAKGDGAGTALYWAVNNKRFENVRRLIFAGAKIELPAKPENYSLRYSTVDETALECATKQKSYSLVIFLLQHGALIRNATQFCDFIIAALDDKQIATYYMEVLYKQLQNTAEIIPDKASTDLMLKVSEITKKLKCLIKIVDEYVEESFPVCISNRNVSNIIIGYDNQLEHFSFFKSDKIESAIVETTMRQYQRRIDSQEDSNKMEIGKMVSR